MKFTDLVSTAAAYTSRFVKAPGIAAGKLINEHKGIRRGLVIWSAWLITHVTLRVFQNPVLITTPAVAAYTVTVGILATVLGFYMQGRNRECKPDVQAPPQ